MLRNPIEEQLHLPTTFVECADGRCRQEQVVVGQKDQRLAGLGVLGANAPQMLGVLLPAVEAIERNGLSANDSGASGEKLRRLPEPAYAVQIDATPHRSK